MARPTDAGIAQSKEALLKNVTDAAAKQQIEQIANILKDFKEFKGERQPGDTIRFLSQFNNGLIKLVNLSIFRDNKDNKHLLTVYAHQAYYSLGNTLTKTYEHNHKVRKEFTSKLDSGKNNFDTAINHPVEKNGPKV